MRNELSLWSSPGDPFRSRLNRIFDQFYGDSWIPARTEDVSNRAWMPAVDIREADDHLLVTAELPGLTRDDVNITLENNVLTLTGERKFEKEAKEENFHRVERSYGAFTRSFALPNNVDPEKVDAAFKDGVLNIRIAKAESARPRKIAIQ